MGHLRLFTVLIGVLSAAYLLMCLVAPSELTLHWEGECSDFPAVEADEWKLPLGAMHLEPVGFNRYVVEGAWGQHDLRIERRVGSEGCVIQVDWTSVHWPFLQRGAASVFDVRGAVLSTLNGACFEGRQ